MGRCGCTSVGASGAAIADSDCLNVSGAGTVGSPFVLSPIVDPDATNLLECGDNGLMVPDPDNPGDWTAYEVEWLSTGTPQPAAVDGNLLGFYRKRGKSIEIMINLLIPNGTGLGSGVYSFTLPSSEPPLIISPLAAIVGVANAGIAYPSIATAVSSGIVYPVEAATADGPFPVGEPAPGGLGWGPGSYIAIAGLYLTS